MSQPSNGASCQSAAETGVTMAAVVKSVAPRSIAGDFIFSAERRRHLSVLSLHPHVIICCRDEPLAHPLITGGSKCKLKKGNPTLQGGWENDQNQPSRNKSLSTETPRQYLPGACYLSSPIRSKFRMPLMFHQ